MYIPYPFKVHVAEIVRLRYKQILKILQTF